MPFAAQKKEVLQKPILCALHGETTPRVPFWFMRQAGRHLPEYRALRAKAGGFMQMCFTPAYAAEATLQPVRRYDADAAILFSDILTIPYALGQDLSFAEGEGPVLGDFDLLSLKLDTGKLEPVAEAASKVRAALGADKTLIGFAGAPWTVACYMLEGRGDDAFMTARKQAIQESPAFDGLIGLLTESTVEYLSMQARAGADAVQLFDSWAGLLPESLFDKYVIQPTRKIVEALAEEFPGLPVIGFPRGSGPRYDAYAAQAGVKAVGLDQHVPLDWAVREMGRDVCLQGNMDPLYLLEGGDAMEEEALRILDLVCGQPFIFNLGHGVIKDTPPEHVSELARIVRGFCR